MSTFTTTNYFRFLPSVWEIAQPFNVNVTTGAIDYSIDPSTWARDHILALLLTSPGERVMRPNYGIGLRSFVFENNDPLVETQMITNIQNGMRLWEPNISIYNVQIVPQPPDFGTFEIRMDYSVGSAAQRYGIQFSVGGVGTEVMR